MKKLIFYVLIASTLGCAKKNEPLELMKFHLPKEVLEEGKLYVYKNVLTSARQYAYYKASEEKGNQVILSNHYTDSQKLDSSKWLVNENKIQLVECFMSYYPDSLSKKPLLLRGNIEQQEHVADIDIIEVRFNLPINAYSMISTKDQFLKDTVFTWNDKQIESKKYLTDITINVKHNWIPFVGSEQNSTVTKYYGKNIGLLQYSNKSEKNFSQWNLIEIK